MKTFSLCG